MSVTLNKNIKHSFVGISLGSQSNTETGIAVLDKDLKIITLDKAFTTADISFFFKNFCSKKNAIFAVSMTEDSTALNSKWKVLAKKFQLLSPNTAFSNRQNWLNRYSTRAHEIFFQQKQQDIDIFRFDIIELKRSLNLLGIYKHRTPTDCKYLQTALKINFNISEIMNNMLPASQLEAILGAILAREIYYGIENNDFSIIGEFKGLDIINLIQKSSADISTKITIT